MKKKREVKHIKYLVSSLDDLKDVVNTVTHILRGSCTPTTLPEAETSIRAEAMPLNPKTSSMILSLKVPVEYMHPEKKKENGRNSR